MEIQLPSWFTPSASKPQKNQTMIRHLYKHILLSLLKSLTRNLLIVVISLELCFFAWGWRISSHMETLSGLLVSAAIIKYWLSRPSKVYLVDFSCLKPPSHLRVPFHSFIEHMSMIGLFDQDSLDFMSKVIHNSGQGEQTYLPPCLHYLPPNANHQDCVEEAQMVLFPVMDDLLSRTNTSPQDIDILIVNCSGFCLSPSLTAVVVNRYDMREDVKTYNVSGMGCAAGVLVVDLAKTLLNLHPDSNAIVLSTEIISVGWYPGKDRTKLVLNCLFRMGCAGVMLSNKREARRKSKYELVCTLRTQRAFDDRAYLSVVREEDEEGLTGVTIKKDLLHVAGDLLRSHLSMLGRMILPFHEQALHAVSVVRRKVRLDSSSKEVYVPDFKSAIHHFCIPPSGRPLIREIGRNLRLRPSDVEPALMTLHRFGNQSAAALWYELAYLEAKGRVKKGDKVWQLGMGTGPKANSAVWKSLMSTDGEGSRAGPWSDCIDDYPVIDL